VIRRATGHPLRPVARSATPVASSAPLRCYGPVRKARTRAPFHALVEGGGDVLDPLLVDRIRPAERRDFATERSEGSLCRMKSMRELSEAHVKAPDYGARLGGLAQSRLRHR